MTGLDAVRAAIEDAESVSGATGYSAWMGAAATVALAKDRQSFLPDSVLRSLMLRCLREAEEDAARTDWSQRDDFETERRELILSPKFRNAFEALMDYDPVVSIKERVAYVATITAEEGDAEEEVEQWLETNDFRRNAIAYLKHRERDREQEYEQGNWAYRKEPQAEKQLHVRVFDGDDPGTVDIYAHREPSITQGDEHFGRPDYKEGVCQLQTPLQDWAEKHDNLSYERREQLPGGTTPKQYDCNQMEPLIN